MVEAMAHRWKTEPVERQRSLPSAIATDNRQAIDARNAQSGDGLPAG